MLNCMLNVVCLTPPPPLLSGPGWRNAEPCEGAGGAPSCNTVRWHFPPGELLINPTAAPYKRKYERNGDKPKPNMKRL